MKDETLCKEKSTFPKLSIGTNWFNQKLYINPIKLFYVRLSTQIFEEILAKAKIPYRKILGFVVIWRMLSDKLFSSII